MSGPRAFRRLLSTVVAVISFSLSCFPQQTKSVPLLSAVSLRECDPSELLNFGSLVDSISLPCPVGHETSLVIVPQKPHREGFHWRRALGESFAFLSMQHGLLLMSGDKKYLYTGIPFDHYWHDYKLSLRSWLWAGWDDGDPFLDNYIGHPIQGALTGYIQIQNDPAGRALEFENTKRYWISRLKATAWAAAYSTQWEIGPLGEMTVEKYGAWKGEMTWWIQNGKVVNGEGQVDLVITPIGALGWMVMED